MADEYDPLSLFLQDAPGVTPIPRVNTSPDRRPWLQRTGDRAVQRIVETAKAEAARKRDPLNALIDALGILPGGQPVALAADMAAQGKHPWKRDVGREIDQFAEGVGEAIRNPADALEVAASEAPADWLGVGMRGHTRGEKPGGDLLMQLGAALGIANATPKPRPRIDAPKAPLPTTASKPFYPERLPDEIDRMPRTGAIKIPDGKVDAVMRDLTRDWRTHPRTANIEDFDGPGFSETSIKRPDGRSRRVDIAAWPENKEFSAHQGFRDRSLIDLNFGESTGRYGPQLRRDLRSILYHELTHAAEPKGLGSSPERAGSRMAYYNDVGEVNANIQQVVQDIRDAADYWRANPAARPMDALVMSDRFDQVSPWLTQDNRRRFLRAAFDTLESIRNPAPAPTPRPGWRVGRAPRP